MSSPWSKGSPPSLPRARPWHRRPRWLEAARRSLQSCDGQSDPFAAAIEAQRAMRSLRLVERAYWDAAVRRLASPVTSPAAVGFDTLPCHWRLFDRLAGADSVRI